MKITKESLLLLLGLSGTATSADTNAWKSRTIYFALTDRIARSYNDGGGGSCSNLGNYCGGTFKGLESKLDYIKGMGFDAIWITPVVQNSPGGYHGYWAQDLYKVNSNYGSADDLKSLVNTAHGKNMFVMVDVVANHVGPSAITDDRPEPMNQDGSYHPACDIDYNNQTSIENCRIAGLPDVDTQDPKIRKVYQDWVKWLVNEYKFDGVRIDTVKHVEKDFWPPFALSAAVYTIGEVFSGDPNYLKGYADKMAGLLNYAIYYPLNKFYQQQGSSQDLVDMHNQFGSSVPDPTTMGTFLDNHDNPRFLNQHNDISSLKNALTYVMLARGIPIVYYGTEQAFAGGGDPQNREDLWRSGYNTQSDMYKFLAKLGDVRRRFGGLPNNDHNHIFVDDTGYAWERADGKLLALTSNIGRGNSRQYCMYTQKNNWTWHDVFTGQAYTSDGNGRLCVTNSNGEPIIMSTQ